MKNFKLYCCFLLTVLFVLSTGLALNAPVTAFADQESTASIITPAQVTGLTAVYQDDSTESSLDNPGYVTLTWNDCGAAYYRVMRYCPGTSDSYTTLTYRATADGYVDTSIPKRGALYYYRVCGYFTNEDGTVTQGAVSDNAIVRSGLIEPTAVTGLTAAYQDNGAEGSWNNPGDITLTWDDCGAVFYKVMRYQVSQYKSSYKTLTYRATAEGFVDDALPERAQLYYYRVCGYFYNEDGTLTQGPVSEPVIVLACATEPTQVTNIAVSLNGVSDSAGSVRLTWDPVEGATGYLIEQGLGAEWPDYGAYGEVQDFKPLVWTGHNLSQYNVSYTKSNWYRYRITAYQRQPDGTLIYGEASETKNVLFKLGEGLVDYVPTDPPIEW